MTFPHWSGGTWFLIATWTVVGLLAVHATYRGQGIQSLARMFSIIPVLVLFLAGSIAYEKGVLLYYLGMYVVIGITNYLLIDLGRSREARWSDLFFWYYRLQSAIEDQVLKIFGQPARRRG